MLVVKDRGMFMHLYHSSCHCYCFDLPLLHYREGKCDFFLWQDNNITGTRIQQNNANSSYGRYQTPQSASIPNSNSRAQYGSGGNSDPNVTCSRCRQIGHYARECSSR